MKALKNFLMMALMPIMALALVVGCEKGPEEEPNPQGPNVTKDSVVTLKKTSVSVGLAGGTTMLEYSITNPHADAKITAETDAEWISNFDTSVVDFLRFEVAPNEGETAREAIVTVKYLYAEDVTFVVSQSAAVNGTFSLENIDVTTDYFSITVDIIPTLKNHPFIIMSASPEYIEAYGLESDEALYADDFAYFEYLGGFYSMSGLDVMMDRAKMGDTRGVTVGNAVPGEKYIFYMYYFDPASGALASDITRIEVTAGHPQLGEADFNFQYEINGPDVAVQVDPAGFEGDYYFDVMTIEELNAAEAAGYTKEEYFVKWWANIVANIIFSEQKTPDTVLAENTCWGEGRNTWDYELMANSTYYVFAFKLEGNSLCCSTPKYEQFTTGDAVMSDNELKAIVTNVTSRAATFTILTTNDDRYSYDCMKAAEWATYGSTDEERVNNLLKKYVYEVQRGDFEISVSNLESDTEYVLYAFGNHGGVATTAPAVASFKTVSDAPGNVTIKFKDLGYYDPSDLIYYPQWSFMDSDYYSGKAIFPVQLEIEPANHGAYAFAIYEWGDRTDEYDDANYISGLLWHIATYGSMTTKYTYVPVLFNVRHVGVAIAVDAEGRYSELYKQEIMCTYDGVNKDIDALVDFWEAMQNGGAVSSVYSAQPKANSAVSAVNTKEAKVQKSNVKASERAEIVRENMPVEANVIPATRF